MDRRISALTLITLPLAAAVAVAVARLSHDTLTLLAGLAFSAPFIFVLLLLWRSERRVLREREWMSSQHRTQNGAGPQPPVIVMQQSAQSIHRKTGLSTNPVHNTCYILMASNLHNLPIATICI